MATKKKKKAPAKKPASSKTSATAAPSATAPPQIVFSREDALRTGRVPRIPGHPRTIASIEAELASIPADFIRTKVPPVILGREAEEMLRREEDLPVFTARGLGVTKGHFEAVGILKNMLPLAHAERDVATSAYRGFDAIEDSQGTQLRSTIARLKLLTIASGLSEELCSLNGAQGNLRLMDAGAAIVARVRPHLALYQPPSEAEALLKDIETYVDGIARLRSQQAGEAGISVMTTDRVHRVKRLLLDTMRYIGALGEYVFFDDPVRLPGYQLQHITEWSEQRKNRRKITSDGDVATFAATDD